MISLEKMLEGQDLKNYTSKVEEVLGYARGLVYHEINSAVSSGDKRRIRRAEKEYLNYVRQAVGVVGKLSKTGELEKVQTAESIANLLMSENYILDYKPTFFDNIKDFFSGLFSKRLKSSNKTINKIYKLENMILDGYKKGLDRVKKEYDATQNTKLLEKLKLYKEAREKTSDFVKKIKGADVLLRVERGLYNKNIETAMKAYNELKKYVDSDLNGTPAYNPIKTVVDFKGKKYEAYIAKQQQKTQQNTTTMPKPAAKPATNKATSTPQKTQQQKTKGGSSKP